MAELLRPSPDVILTEVGDGTGVLLHLATKFYFTLNATGVAVWKVIEQHKEGGATRAQLIDELVRRFRVDAPTAERDLAPLVDELVAEGLASRA